MPLGGWPQLLKGNPVMSLLASFWNTVLRRTPPPEEEEEEETFWTGQNPELEEWEITVPVTRIRTIVTGLDAFLRGSAGRAKVCYAIGQVQPSSPESLGSLHLLFDGHPGIEVLWCGVPRKWEYRLVPPAKATPFLVKLQAGAPLDLLRFLLRDFNPDPILEYAVFDRGGASDYALEAEAVARVKKGYWFYWTGEPTSVISKPEHFLYRCEPFICAPDGLDAAGDMDVSGAEGTEWIRYGPEAPEALKRLVARESSGR